MEAHRGGYRCTAMYSGHRPALRDQEMKETAQADTAKRIHYIPGRSRRWTKARNASPGLFAATRTYSRARAATSASFVRSP